MRILIASDHYPPFIGGAHIWAQKLAAGLHQRGHTVGVLTEWHLGFDRREEDSTGSHDGTGWPVYRVRQLRTWATSRVTSDEQRHAPPFFDPVSARDSAEVLDDFSPDICIAQGWTVLSIAGVCERRRVPLLLSGHDYAYFCATTNLLRDGQPCSGPGLAKCVRCASNVYGTAKGTTAAISILAERPRLARAVAGVQTVTSYVDEQTWRELFGPSGPSHLVRRYVIPSFVERHLSPAADEPEVAPILAQLPSEPFIMYAGALRGIKGVQVLLDAYRQLREPRPPMVLMGAPYPDAPTDFPPGVTVLESVPHRAVLAAWERAMIAVVPSVWPEPGATVAMESTARGIPTIGTYPSGLSDILGDGAGILVRQGSVDELRDALQTLVNDPQRRAELSEAGRERSKLFDREYVLDKYEAAVHQMVADRASMATPG